MHQIYDAYQGGNHNNLKEIINLVTPTLHHFIDRRTINSDSGHHLLRQISSRRSAKSPLTVNNLTEKKQANRLIYFFFVK